MVLPASYAGYADDEYGISIPTVEDYKKLGKFAAETFTPYGDIQTGKDAYNAYQQGEYLKALANAGLLGLGYTPFGMVARPVGRLGKRALNAAVDPDYRSVGDVLGNPASMPARDLSAAVAPLSKAAQELSEAAQVNKLIADNKNKFNTKDFYEFSRKKFRQKYMNEFDNDPSMQFMSLMHSSKRPDLTLDNFNFGSSKTKDFSDALKHKGIAPDPVFAQGQGGIFAKQVAEADNFLTDPYYKNYLNRYIVTSGFKKPPLGPGGMDLERRAGAPMSQRMGLRQRNPDGTITVTPTTKVPMDEYFIPEKAIKDTGGIDKVYSLENVTDYLRSLK